MMITRFTKRCVVLMATLGLVLSTSGCFFNLSKEKDFKSWYFGEPGMAGALGETRCDPYADRIHGERHPYYLHFRTLEVLYQPQGGTRYPERSAATALDREGGRVAYACGIVDEGRETFNFNAVDAGLVDVIIPYRKATAVSGEAPQDYDTGSYAGSVVYNTGIAAVMKAPVYVVHDVLKTIYIPVAGTYFLFKSDEDTDAAAEALADGDGAPVSEAEREPPTAEKTVPEVVDTVDKVDGTPASMAAATETEASDTPSDEAVVASDDMRETATPETSDNEAVAPQATVAESQTAAEPPADHADAAPIETTDAIAAGDTQTGEAVEASESIPDRETVETPDTEVVEPSPVEADVKTEASDTPSDEAVVASDDMREMATPETSDSEAVAPQATVAESQTAAEPPADHADAAPIETTDAIAAGDTQTGEAVEASESIPDRETVETPDTEVVEPSPAEADVEAVAAASTGTGDVPAVPVDGEDSVESAEPAIIASEIETTETTPVAVAAVEEANQPGAEPEAVDASPDTTISEEDLTDVSTDREVAEPMATETVEGPQEEEAPMMAPATDVKASAGDITTPSMPEEETALPEMTDQETSVDIASVTEGQESHAGAASLPVQLEEVEISKRKLKKQVAFLGFLSRAATVDTQTKGLFEDKLWPAFMDECSRSVLMLRKGDPRFPNGLTQLSRDQFGRLNSFELTTVARFSGINAVVTGSVIDIRIANEISGILWYKEPEGALRVAILVEVYDAETGTKLLDKTLVHHTEVDELAPGSEGKLRDVDMPFVREALDSIASEMSEMVCDVLDDQPWRAFISGIDGSRITLSAGVDTGLVPGNILTVYNSQIIEGLNNQQFFLTGERVGRLQITQVFPDRSEANLIEGANLQDYSLVLPE